VKLALAVVVAALAAVVAVPAGGAADECHGIQRCIPVQGPWVVVPAGGTAQYLLSCPGGKSVVGGLDAEVTSRAVHVDFRGRLGAPVQPGTTTTRYALFRAVSTSHRAELFRPLLGCIPVQGGGGGRSTVSARVSSPGPTLELRSRIVVVRPSAVRFGRVSCGRQEQLTSSWHAVAFRTKSPPRLADVRYVQASHVVVGKHAVVTASSTDALSIDVHAIVQVGVECAP
jgi:hypothetical protein